MMGVVPLASRNLLRQKLRFVLSMAGVGLALLLILSLDSIYTAVLRQVTAYPDNAGSPLIASQRAVETMHMSNSALPMSVVDDLRGDKRVARAEPILYQTVALGRKQQVYSYLIGFRKKGGPWRMVKGSSRPKDSEIVIDKRTAERLGVGVGAKVRIAGRRLKVVGLASGTTSVISSVAFVSYKTMERLLGTVGSASYVLIWPAKGQSADELASKLERDHAKVTVQTKEEFSKHERQVVSDMSTGLIRGMLIIGFIVGVVVAGLSIYTATTSRLREYAMLKAIGMRNMKLYGMISRQALMTVAAGLLLAMVLLFGLSQLVPRLDPIVSMVITPESLLRAVAITAIMGLISALLPARRVARVDPASVYRS